MKLYEKMADGENMGWCAPYTNDDETTVIAVNCGECVGLMIDGEDADGSWGEKIHEMAVAKYGDEYEDIDHKAWTDLILATEDMSKTGCADCPWRDECDAMDECDEGGEGDE